MSHEEPEIDRAGVAHAFWTDPLQLQFKLLDCIVSELPSPQLLGVQSQVKRCKIILACVVCHVALMQSRMT